MKENTIPSYMYAGKLSGIAHRYHARDISVGTILPFAFVKSLPRLHPKHSAQVTCLPILTQKPSQNLPNLQELVEDSMW